MGQQSSTNLFQIDGVKTDFYNPTVKRYLENDPTLLNLLGTQDLTSIYKQTIESERFSQDYREKLVHVILQQYQDSGISLSPNSKVFQNIESLRKSSTVTATTGQQIHIFLGPFFMANKLLSCVAEAKRISNELEVNCVPVFWLATEDHDFDEVNSVRLYNEVYKWDIESNGPVGRLKTNGLVEIADAIEQRIDQSPENLKFVATCKAAYDSDLTFAEATRQILHTYFGDTGIVILDADNDLLKSNYVDILKQDILNHNISPKIDEQIGKMKDAGVKAPINTRPINHFLVSDTSRDLIELTDDGLQLRGNSPDFTDASTTIENSPSQLSPNALLRTIYQQAVLPNVHYTCGASEFVYWMEMPLAMKFADVVYPALGIRSSVFHLKIKNLQVIENESLSLDSLFLNDTNFKKVVSKQNDDATELLLKNKDLLVASWQNLIESLEHEGTQTNKINQSFESLKNKVNKEIERITDMKSNNSSSFNRLIKVKDKVWADNANQERDKSLLSMVPELDLTLAQFNNSPEKFANNNLLIIVT